MASRYLILALAGYVSAQIGNAQFNQVINLNGDMNLNAIQFPDGTKIEAYSQTQRQLLVNQNQAPLPGNQVTGSTGNPFMMLSQNSLIIQTNGGTDLVGAQIELPINQQMLQQSNIIADNTFVAKLAPDRRSWMIMETIKSVNGTDNTVRLVKMNNIDGEYAALGRQTPVTSLALTQFSSTLNQGFNVTGSGIQENEFTDGFRMSVRSTQPMLINTNVVNGVSSTMTAALGPNVQSINNYRYLVSTNLAGVVPNINRMVAVVQLPINPIRLQTVAKNQGAGPNSMIRLTVAQRGILANPGGAQGSIQPQKRQDPNQQAQPQPNQNPNQQAQPQDPNANNGQNTNGQTNNGQTNNGQTNNGQTNNGTPSNNPAATKLLLSPTFTPIAANAVLDQMNGRLAIPVSQVDGEYIITVQNMDGQQQQGGQIQGQGQGQGQLQGQGQGQGQIQGQGQGQGQIQGQGQGEVQGQGQGQIQGSQPSGTAQEPQGARAQGATPAGERPSATPAGERAGAAPAAGIEGERPGAAPAAGIAGEPAGVAPAAAAPAVAPAAAPAAAPAVAPAVAPAAAPAVAPAAAAPAAVAPAAAPATPQVTSSFVSRRVKRQFGNPAALPQAPASAQAQTNGGGVLVSMAWINMMARVQSQGLPIDVGAMMSEFSTQQGVVPAAATDPLASLGL